MTPHEVKKSIFSLLMRMIERADRKEINRSFIYGKVEDLAREGARHCGIPECWREFMPPDTLEKIYGKESILYNAEGI
jgi:hypothetical protein